MICFNLNQLPIKIYQFYENIRNATLILMQYLILLHTFHFEF